MNRYFWIQLDRFRCPVGDVNNNSDDDDDDTQDDDAQDDETHLVERWRTGKLSNFDYLMALNRLAGRSFDNVDFHPILPWVIDFSVAPDPANATGWRDLTRSKCRLTKGDEQLDFTYGATAVPHHLTDVLSDLTFFHYCLLYTSPSPRD